MTTRKTRAAAARTAGAARPALKKSGQRDRRKEATRAAILQAALQIFSEHGFNGASTRDIAARAGVNHALIKYHYQSKDLLWRAAVSYLFERQARELVFEPPEGPPKTRAARREAARESLRRYVLYCARYPEHARLMVQESVRDSERLQWAVDHFIRRTSRAAAAFVRALQDDDLLPIASAPALVYIIVGAAQSFYTLAPEVRRVWKMDPGDEKVMSAHVDALLAVFIR